MRFASKEAAYYWADRHAPRRPAGCVSVVGATPQKEGGEWVLRYTVVHPGFVRYLLVSTSGHLVGK